MSKAWSPDMMMDKEKLMLQAKYDNRRIAINYGFEHATRLPHTNTDDYIANARKVADTIEHELNQAFKLLGSEDGDAKTESKLS
jgi:hypothetical protein